MRVVVTATRASRCAALLLFFTMLWAAPPGRAEGLTGLDAERLMRAVVGVSAVAPPDTQSSRNLGTEREGSGIVIDGSGLILTIGYTVMEASEIRVTTLEGKEYPATLAAYDPVSGLSLLRAGLGFESPWIRLGDSKAVSEGDALLALSGGKARSAAAVKVVGKREFAGYWEYLLDEALFTFPPIRAFNGAALVDSGGRLIGVGSLLVAQAMEGRGLPGNMFVPVSALEPILADLLAYGKRQEPARPWLGVTLREEQGRLVVERVSPRGPAESAGVRPGDQIVGVGGQRFSGLADFYRKLWGLGPAGVVVPLELLRGATLAPVSVPSADRVRFLRLNPTL
ncbi:S1C family serine protease [Azospirillum doebereinerae]|uniref:Serine protease n=2 Tax=Azospirillum doebereinerae TaxID=92933 RepID=A0A3S0X1D3_9PROT|nr:S1C family serine protease [Azospirillum doebereinerae]MCG5240413.1 S1C family serine protease [Azospirillum doebereinerae]RUQ74904.1 serine protease [Azospirillum doebereinerae]